MKIKKVDDKSMIIHTKEKTKIHMHENKDAMIKGHNVYMVDHSPMSNGSTTKQTESVNNGKESYSKSTIHQNRLHKLNPISQYQQKWKDSNRSVKIKHSTIKNAGLISASTTLNQLEGGEEMRNSATIASTIARPITSTASKGTSLFRKKIFEERKAKIKRVDVGKKLGQKKFRDTAVGSAQKFVKDSAKKAAKDSAKVVAKEAAKVGAKVAGTAEGKAVGIKLDRDDIKRTNRNRKIKFFLDKMKAGDNQTDSFSKLAKDLIFKKASVAIKYIAKYIGSALLTLFLLIAVAVLPLIMVIGIIYNSPLAIFFPPLESGDTIMTITSQYEAEFNRDVNTLASNHTGYDDGIIVYVDYEGMSANPSNYYDIMAVYLVKYGVGDTATIMNDTSKAKLKTVFDDMCSYTTTSETETVENEDGTISFTTELHVNVTLKSYRDMISAYNFNSDEVELLEITMDPENLALIGHTGGGSGGGNAVSELSQAEIAAIVSGITDAKAKQTCTYALNKVGYPYSQDYRDSGNYYDCSSLAYYSYKAAGIDISYGGATTAAAEGQGLDEAGKTVSYEEIQPGDLIFYSYCSNGRYKNISHVAVYVGNGKAVEALNETVGVIYRDVSIGSIVMIGRPQ